MLRRLKLSLVATKVCATTRVLRLPIEHSRTLGTCLVTAFCRLISFVMLNERIRALRLAKGLTLQQVGDVFGISRASVSAWENGVAKPTRQN